MNEPISEKTEATRWVQRIPWRIILVGAIVWTGCFFVFAIQFRFATEQDWSDVFMRSLRDWSPWILLTPLVFFLSNRFRLGRRRWPLHLLIHLAASVACVFVAEGIVRGLFDPPHPDDDPNRRGPKFRQGSPPPIAGPDGGQRNPDGENPPPHTQNNRPVPRHRARPPLPRQTYFETSIRKMQLWLPVYWVLASIAHALLFYRRLEDRERRALTLEKRLAEAHLDTLKNQLEPHFLFNALNAIATLVHKDPDRADTMIVRLSTLLRRFLDTGTAQVIPLSYELEFLRAYLDIEKIRFGDRLNVTEDIAQDTLSANIPVMLLQPLAENAVRHGIEPLGRPGTLSITVRREGDRLLIQLADDGVGLNLKPGEAKLDTARVVIPRGRGIGVSNAHARLEALYGDGGFILEIEPHPDGGTVVTLEIPFTESKPEGTPLHK